MLWEFFLTRARLQGKQHWRQKWPLGSDGVCFKITAIKFKVKEKINKIIDWKKINGDAETNIEFNLRLSENIINKHTYTDFNDAILQASKVAITTKPTNQGWFHHSKDYLLLSIKLRNYLLTILRNMNE